MISDSIGLDRHLPARLSPDRCGIARPDCPHRRACARDAAQLARARAGSRADFDALYERFFALFYGAASRRLRSRERAEQCTRELMAAVFRAPGPANVCSSAQLLLLVKRLDVDGTAVADRLIDA